MPPTGQTKSKTALIVTVIILVILAISASVVGYYLSTIKDLTPDETSANNLDASTLCLDVFALSNLPDSTDIELIPSSTRQNKDLNVDATNRFFALYSGIPATFTGTSYTKFSFVVNGANFEAVPKSYEDLAEADRLLIETYATEQNIALSTLLKSTFSVVEDSESFIKSTSLNIIASAEITGPAGDQTASCGAIFGTNATDVNPSNGDVDNDTSTDPDATDDNTDDSDNQTDDDIANNGDDTSDPTDTDSDSNVTSNLKLTIAGDLTCVERVSGSNAIRITITVKNNDNDPELVTRLINKLPLGFSYTANSTMLNGVAYADSNLNIASTGSTSELQWEPTSPWTLNAGQSLVMRFDAIAGSGALSGVNQNEAVVTPLNTPVDPSTLRANLPITVAQSCTSPQTGIFDNTYGRIAISVLLIVVAAGFYYSSVSENVSAKLLTSVSESPINRGFISIGERIKMLGLRFTHPRRHFEENIQKKKRK